MRSSINAPFCGRLISLFILSGFFISSFAHSSSAINPNIQRSRLKNASTSSNKAHLRIPESDKIESRVEKLLSRMTLEEKIEMISGTGFSVRPLKRLGIPELKMTDGPSGARIPPPSTAYAAGIGLAASWNPSLAYQIGQQIGRDAKARGSHFLLGPGANIYRAPLNGRNFEYFGEDPYLGSQIAVGYINGTQSERVCATIKHYLGNNSEFARNTSNSVIDERTLREIYLPIFETAVKEAHVGAIMDSYNLTNGSYLTENGYFNTEVAKKQWGFQGVVMSDWGATHDAIRAANGGLDLEMPFGQYMNAKNLLPAIQEGKVTVATIDDKVRRILRLAARFGWLDHEQLDASIPIYNQRGRRAALDGARQGIVLLKNAGGALPLDKKKAKRIAILGPDAYPAIETAGGSGHVPAFSSVSLLTGVSDSLGVNGSVTYARGIPTLQRIAKSTAFTTEAANGGPGVFVQTFDNADCSGEPESSRTDRFISMARQPFGGFDFADSGPPPSGGGGGFPNFSPPKPTSMRFSGYYSPKKTGFYNLFVQSGDNFRVWVDDRLILDEKEFSKTTISQAKLYLPTEPHLLVLEIYRKFPFGQPSVQLGISLDGSLADPDAVKLAAKADVAIVAVGFDSDTETEGADREFMLPPGQDDLIRAVAAVNKRTIVVIISGGSVDVVPWLDRVAGLFEVWYPGQEGGTAFAEALFGETNPSGRLPISWERKLQDNPSFPNYYYAEPGSNQIVYKEGIFVGYRGFQRNRVKPLFPFGYGLSYSRFKYGGLSIKPADKGIGPGPYYKVSFDVTNVSDRPGADVSQIYVSEPGAKISRPLRELKGFARTMLKPGETKRASVIINGRAFAYFDVKAKNWRIDSGAYVVSLGRSSEEIIAQAKIQLPKANLSLNE